MPAGGVSHVPGGTSDFISLLRMAPNLESVNSLFLEFSIYYVRTEVDPGNYTSEREAASDGGASVLRAEVAHGTSSEMVLFFLLLVIAVYLSGF